MDGPSISPEMISSWVLSGMATPASSRRAGASCATAVGEATVKTHPGPVFANLVLGDPAAAIVFTGDNS
jgi:hypothetical protein